jgi:hypothetical protein
MSKWGLAKDEFTDNGNWPHQLYIREARRMIGDFVMTEADALGKTNIKRSIGMGSYALDSHNAQRYVTNEGFVQNEGDIGAKPERPYGIDYGPFCQRRRMPEPPCSGLRVKYAHRLRIHQDGTRVYDRGSIIRHRRVLSIDKKVPPQRLPYETLKTELMKYNQVLEYKGAL